MSSKSESPFGALKRVFHEPNRLAILSALSNSANGLRFKELKALCELTDGNLNRHLKTLEDAGIIFIEKKFVGAKPRTTVMLTDAGREQFIEYLQALEEVLKTAAEAITQGEQKSKIPFAWIKPLLVS